MSDPMPPPVVAEPLPDAVLPRLGRLRARDERDRKHLARALPTARTFRSWLTPGTAWDQGASSMCVAYSTLRWMLCHPIVNKPTMTQAAFYRECQLNDEWAGEDYDGTSVRAAFKVLKRLGYCSSYQWAFDVDTVANHMLEVGPMVFGIDWTTEMFKPDLHGYIWPRGENVGGHAILGVAVNRKRANPDGSVGAIRLLNSWGPDWGDKKSGRAWLSFGSLGTLLKGLDPRWPGEACAATEVKLAA
jgi:hypothetical protein